MNLQLLSYISVGVCVAALVAKTIHYFSMPLHLRWELYPVPHEKGKEYGGSYFEELNWWEKDIKKDHLGAIKFLLIEIFLVKSLFHDNRKLWYVSYPFHLGLYLFFASLGIIIFGALVGLFIDLTGIALPGIITDIIAGAATGLGMLSFVIGSFGCIGLFLRRLFVADLRAYSSAKDFFNLLLILSVFVTGLIAYVNNGQAVVMYQDYIKSIITVSVFQVEDMQLASHIIFLLIFAIYLPFTHMTHFIAKYFLWDKVRWDDEVNLPGSKIEGKINELLTQNIEWSAPHLDAGKNWVENATKEVE